MRLNCVTVSALTLMICFDFLSTAQSQNDTNKDNQAAYDRLTSSEKRKVDTIRSKLKNTHSVSSLTHHEKDFAWSGEGRECLLDELTNSVAAHPDQQTSEGIRLLDWKPAVATAFACDTDLNGFQKEHILRLAQTLVDRDDKISDRNIKFIRQWDLFLGDAFDKYNKLGIDQTKFAERLKKEASAATLQISNAKDELADLQKQLPDLKVPRKKMLIKLRKSVSAATGYCRCQNQTRKLWLIYRLNLMLPRARLTLANELLTIAKRKFNGART